MAKYNDLFSPAVLSNPEVFFRGLQGLSPEEQWQAIFRLNQMANGAGQHPDSLRQSIKNILDIYRMEQNNSLPLPPVGQSGRQGASYEYTMPPVSSTPNNALGSTIRTPSGLGERSGGLSQYPLPPVHTPAGTGGVGPELIVEYPDDNLYPNGIIYPDDDNLYPNGLPLPY